MVRLLETPCGSSYKNSSKYREKLLLVWTFLAVRWWMIWPWLLHPGSRWMPNILISSEIRSDWWTILGHPQMIECMGICVLSLAHGSELIGSNVYQQIVKKWYGNFSLNSARVGALGWPLLGIFFWVFLIFWWGSMGLVIDREYVVYQGSSISCSLAS